MTKPNIEKFEKDLLICLKKLKMDQTKNVYITSNLTKISKFRIPKKDKLNLLYKCIKKKLGKNHSIFVPTATLNLCNTKIPFDLKNTPSDKMGPFAEYIRSKNSTRSNHPFWSVSGIGKNAKILKSVSKHAYGYGSPWSKMLDLDFLQLNIGMHPSKAVTLVHHIETIVGVPYRYNKLFKHKIKLENKIYEDNFYQSVFFKETDSKKKINLNEHFFEELKKRKKLNYTKHSSGLEMWSFKMKDFFSLATEFFIKDIYTYLEFKPNLNKISKY
tara:strand:+ start:3299 stop:4114 length:816 start_codon:yes stop_codon:yes gene_type:complete